MSLSNPADFLYKESSRRGLDPPQFKQIKESGPPHAKTFFWECRFQGVAEVAEGRTKKEAKINAARAITSRISLVELETGETSNGGGDADPNKKRRFNRRKWNKKGRNDHGMFVPPLGCPPFGIPPGGPFGRPFGPRPPMRPIRITIADEQVKEKHNRIMPKNDTVNMLYRITEKTEYCLDQVCTKFKSEKVENQIVNISRVGDFVKQTMLRGDHTIHFVLVFQKWPAVSDVTIVNNSVEEEFRKLAVTKAEEEKEQKNDDNTQEQKEGEASEQVQKEETENKNMQQEETSFDDLPVVVANSDGFSLQFQTKDPDCQQVQIDISMTSQEVRTLTELPSPSHLPLSLCQDSLCSIRRSNWFSSTCFLVPSCVETVRVIKDLRRRDPKWTPLTDWCIELLCERVLVTTPEPCWQPSGAVRRVLESISSGLFLSDGLSLADPCERDPVNVTEYLTMQEREDLTASAQTYLRLCAFNQMEKVLAMERLAPRKRRNKSKEEEEETKQDQEKKQKVEQ